MLYRRARGYLVVFEVWEQLCMHHGDGYTRPELCTLFV